MSTRQERERRRAGHQGGPGGGGTEPSVWHHTDSPNHRPTRGFGGVSPPFCAGLPRFSPREPAQNGPQPATASMASASSASEAAPSKAADTTPAESTTNTHGSEGRPHSAVAGTTVSSSG